MNTIGDKKLGFIGSGNMAEAICRGVLKAELFTPKSVSASDIQSDRRQCFNQMNVYTTDNSSEVVSRSNLIVIAVKPQFLQDALEDLRSLWTPEHLVISIVAGATISKLEQLMPTCPIIRTMPNTPMLIGEGITAIAGGSRTNQDHLRQAEALMATGGGTVIVPEAMLDAVTALSGSGPAYVFYLAEAMIDAAVEAGLPREVAEQLFYQTVRGAAGMMMNIDKTPLELRQQVTSPHGTTEAAISVFDENNIKETLKNGLLSAVKRSFELRAEG